MKPTLFFIQNWRNWRNFNFSEYPENISIYAWNLLFQKCPSLSSSHKTGFAEVTTWALSLMWIGEQSLQSTYTLKNVSICSWHICSGSSVPSSTLDQQKPGTIWCHELDSKMPQTRNCLVILVSMLLLNLYLLKSSLNHPKTILILILMLFIQKVRNY